MNGDDLEAYWRELVDICPCAVSGSAGYSLLMEIGMEKHAAIPKGWSHHPTKSEKKDQTWLLFIVSQLWKWE